MMIASGKVDPSPLLTGTVGLEGVATAFEQLADPEQHAKILIDPEQLGHARRPSPSLRSRSLRSLANRIHP